MRGAELHEAHLRRYNVESPIHRTEGMRRQIRSLNVMPKTRRIDTLCIRRDEYVKRLRAELNFAKDNLLCFFRSGWTTLKLPYVLTKAVQNIVRRIDPPIVEGRIVTNVQTGLAQQTLLTIPAI